MFPLPSLSLYCSLCSLWARPGRLMLYLAPGGKVSALFWSLSLPPTTSTPLLNPHRGRLLARSGAPSPPRITRLHPPKAEQEGRQSCGMRVQRGACQILCPFDSFTSLLWITWRLLNINKRRLRGSNSPQSTCYTHTHTHTRAQRLTCNTLAASFIFLTRPLAPTSMQGVHIAPQIPQITVSLCVCVRTAAASWSSDSHICSPPKKVLSEEKTDKLRRRGDNERERHVKTNREREEKCVKSATEDERIREDAVIKGKKQGEGMMGP